VCGLYLSGSAYAPMVSFCDDGNGSSGTMAGLPAERLSASQDLFSVMCDIEQRNLWVVGLSADRVSWKDLRGSISANFMRWRIGPHRHGHGRWPVNRYTVWAGFESQTK
jgi:hypothetical protein